MLCNTGSTAGQRRTVLLTCTTTVPSSHRVVKTVESENKPAERKLFVLVRTVVMFGVFVVRRETRSHSEPD